MSLAETYRAGCEVLGTCPVLGIDSFDWVSMATGGAKKQVDDSKQREALAKAVEEQKRKDRQDIALYGIMGIAALGLGAALFMLLGKK